jgi:hypothetical protein
VSTNTTLPATLFDNQPQCAGRAETVTQRLPVSPCFQLKLPRERVDDLAAGGKGFASIRVGIGAA